MKKCTYWQVQKIYPIFEIGDLGGKSEISMKSYHKGLSNQILLLNDSGSFAKSQVPMQALDTNIYLYHNV